MGENKNKIFFLTYLARSGSTLLSKKLSQIKNLGVGIEEDIEDNISKGCFKLKSEEGLDKYLDQIFSDEKFKNWKIKKSDLKTQLLSNHKFPISFNEVLTEIFDLYFNGEQKEVYVHKKGNYYLFWREVLKTFPNSKFIFIYRDPRAIYNSQSKNKNSQNRIMQKNIYTFAYSYRLAHRLLSRLNKRNDKLLTIKYEDLVINEDYILNLIFYFLYIEKLVKSGSNDYYKRIPENQLHLHNNVKLNYNDDKRINAWKSELSNSEIFIIEKLLKKEIVHLDYKLLDVSLNNLSAFRRIILSFRLSYYKSLNNLKLLLRLYLKIHKLKKIPTLFQCIGRFT